MEDYESICLQYLKIIFIFKNKNKKTQKKKSLIPFIPEKYIKKILNLKDKIVNIPKVFGGRGENNSAAAFHQTSK